jgi:hypothetical protein
MNPHGPVQVAIAPFAALYLIERGSEHFTRWLKLLEESRDARRTIVFTYELNNNLHISSLKFEDQ